MRRNSSRSRSSVPSQRAAMMHSPRMALLSCSVMTRVNLAVGWSHNARMSSQESTIPAVPGCEPAGAGGADASIRTAFPILMMLSVCHLINDMIQSLILAMYPILKGEFQLSFAQIGLITLTFQLTASLFPTACRTLPNTHPTPYALPMGMGFTLCGLLLLAFAPNFGAVLVAAAFVGIGSAVFHPESSRVARMASGGRHGLAQSHVPGRRQHGRRHRPADGRTGHRAARPAQHRLVRAGGVAGHILLLQVSGWYAADRVSASATRSVKREVSQFPAA